MYCLDHREDSSMSDYMYLINSATIPKGYEPTTVYCGGHWYRIALKG